MHAFKMGFLYIVKKLIFDALHSEMSTWRPTIMDREGFLESLRQQYSDEIEAAYRQSEHGLTVDLVKFNHDLLVLRHSAVVEGLPERDFDELIQAVLPHIVEKVDFLKNQKNAA